MNQERNLVEPEDFNRKPGQRPDAREREELLGHVERALFGGASRPADVLDAVPEIGTWDTAKSYMEEVRARWRDEASREERREQRAEMVAMIRATRQRAFVAMGRETKSAEIVRLGRLIDTLIQREVFLLGLNPEELAGEDRRIERKAEKAAEKAAEAMEKAFTEAIAEEESRERKRRRDARDAERAKLAQKAGDPENQNPARTDPSNPTEPGAGEEVAAR